MKSLNWKKSLIFCVSFFAVFFGEVAVNIACGPEQDPYDYYVSYFHNNVQGDDYKPFAFNGMLFLNSEHDVWEEKDVNSAEWAKYLGVKLKDVRKIMYELDSASNAKLKKSSFKWTTSLPDSLKNNSFLIAINKNQAALNYYKLLKQCEPMISHNADSWTEPIVDSVFLMKNADKNLVAISNFKDDFLKLRYAYQIQRMYRYAGNLQQSKVVYEKFIVNNPSSSAVKGWAMSQYAGILRADGKIDEAAFLFSKVFSNNPERRIMAYRNYFWTDAKMKDVLRLAKTDREKANIWGINGFRKPDSDIEHLKEVYNCEPNHPLVSALLIREVNKLEQNLLEKSKLALNFVDALNDQWQYYAKNQDSLKTANLKHLQTIKSFVLEMASNQKYQQQGFANITAAYLSWMGNKEDAAIKYLDKVDVNKLSPKFKDQFRITDLLIRANQLKKGNKFDENSLLPTLKWLDEKRFAENKKQWLGDWNNYTPNDGSFPFSQTTRDFYQQILAPAYAKNGDTASAALAMLKGDLEYKTVQSRTFKILMSYQTYVFWHQALSEKTLQQLAQLKQKKSSRTLNGFLIESLNSTSSDDFYELQGTSYIRSHQYANAIQCFNKLSKNFKFWTNDIGEWDNKVEKLRIVGAYYANPFIETIKDSPKKYVKNNNGINKKVFAQEMLRLQKLIISDAKNTSKYYYQMANAIYQTGEFGNAWYFISYDSKVFEHPEFSYNYNNDYQLATTAKTWYIKARELSKDPNFKAKCTYMIAKCEQKKIIKAYKNLTWVDSDDYEKDREIQLAKFKQMMNSNAHYNELKQYAKTPFYKTAVNECSYLRDFLKGK
ncbi:MAG: hypothetical protein EOP00_05040 [Pedobacter sp.]|nr:MAG: hypothetical protein EOP00_05040 [Pedobacter sp.]